MSQLILKKDAKGNINKAIIKDAVAFYCKVQKPSPIYEQRMMQNPTKTEYSVDLLVSEEVADEWDEVFTKQPSKKFTAAKFKEKFKIEDESVLPDPKAKKFFIIKVKQAAQKKDGSDIHPKMRPRVAQVVDNKPVDITFKELVGNGSKVDVLMRANENDFGCFAYLGTVKVNDLISYSTDNSDEDEEEFLGGSMELDEEPEDNGVDTSEDHDDGSEDIGGAPVFDDSEDDY